MPNTSFPVLLQRFFDHLRATQEASVHTIAAYRDTLKLLLHFIAKQQRASIDRITFRPLAPKRSLRFWNICRKNATIPPAPAMRDWLPFAHSFVFRCTSLHPNSLTKLNGSSPSHANARINLCSAFSVGRRSRPSSRPQIERHGREGVTICSLLFSTIQAPESRKPFKSLPPTSKTAWFVCAGRDGSKGLCLSGVKPTTKSNDGAETTRSELLNRSSETASSNPSRGARPRAGSP